MSDTTTAIAPQNHLELLRRYDKFIRAKQVAKILGCPAAMVYTLEQRGDIKGYRISNRSLRFDPAEIERYMAKITAPGYVSPLLSGPKPAMNDLEKRVGFLEETVASLQRVIRMRSCEPKDMPCETWRGQDPAVQL